jgi:hypothetical protein
MRICPTGVCCVVQLRLLYGFMVRLEVSVGWIDKWCEKERRD